MRRLEVRYRPAALDDLRSIYDFVRHGSGSAIVAERFVRRIRDRCHSIGDVPNGGFKRDDLLAGLRIVPFERTAVIAYQVEAEFVRIVGIYYGGRDYDALFREEWRD